jgi:hypothetical protein
MSERTKGPWTRSCFQVYGGDKSRIAHTGMGQLPLYRSSESEANAAAIVLWENHFDELVKTMEEVQKFIDPAVDPSRLTNQEMCGMIRVILAKVKT